MWDLIVFDALVFLCVSVMNGLGWLAGIYRRNREQFAYDGKRNPVLAFKKRLVIIIYYLFIFALEFTFCDRCSALVLDFE